MASPRGRIRSRASPAGTPGALPGRAVPGVDPMLSVGMGAVDPDDESTANDVWMTVSGYLTPTTLLRGTLGTDGAPDAAPEPVKRAPKLFDATSLTVTQHFTRSTDGTRVPYFQVGPAAEDGDDGPAPVMLDGYGGFELSRLPGYAPTIGLGWLEKGGISRRREHPRRWGVRPRLAHVGAAGEPSARLRGLRRRGPRPRRPGRDGAAAARLLRRLQRRAAGGKHAHAVPRRLRRGLLRRPAPGHASLHEAVRRSLLGRRVRGPG